MAPPSTSKPATAAPMQYPANLSTQTYFMSFHFVKYQRAVGEAKATYLPNGSIYLPMPLNIIEQYGIQYGDRTLGLFGNHLDEALKSGQDGLASAWDRIKNFDYSGVLSGGKNAINNDLKNVLLEMGRVAQTVTPNWLQDRQAGSAASRYFGLIQNPHLAPIFDGVELRKHEFAWRMSPRNRDEANTLRSIINSFRRHSHPKFTEGMSRFALDYPDQVYANFIGTNYLFPIKRSVINRISVNNTPNDGGAAFYAGGSPVAVEFAISLTEVEILTQEDFTDPPWANDGGNFYTPPTE